MAAKKDALSKNRTSHNAWLDLLSFTTTTSAALLCAATTTAIASGVAGPVYNIFFGKVLESFTELAAERLDKTSFLHKVSSDCGLIAIIGLANCLLNGVYFALWIAFGEMQAQTCRHALLTGMLDKPISWFETLESGIGASMPQIESEVRELQIAISQPLGSIIRATATALTGLGISFYYCWTLTLIVLISIPVSAMVLAIVSSRLQLNIDNQQRELATALKQTVAAFGTIENVKCFNSQALETRRYIDVICRAAKWYLFQARIFAVQIAFARFMGLCMFTAGFGYGSHLVVTGQQTIGNIITAIFSVLVASSAIQSILPNMPVLQKGKTAAARLRSLTKWVEKNELVIPEGRRLSKCLGNIEFERVDFNYPSRPSQSALKDVTYRIPAGKTVFIIGHSGSGKSTVAQLLLRLYEPSGGEIFLDGEPLSELDPTWLRHNITLIEQCDTFFEGTVAENIALAQIGQDQIVLEDVKLAVEFALLKETINDFPDGLNTHINMDGSNLSGGQRQRMALARARLRDSSIVIFDESMSALDRTSRSLMLSAIRYWRDGRTTIFISHDISQIEQDDIVYILDHGHIVEHGYRSDLEVHSTIFQAHWLRATYSDGRRNAEISNDGAVGEDTTARLEQNDDGPRSREDLELFASVMMPCKTRRLSRASFISMGVAPVMRSHGLDRLTTDSRDFDRFGGDVSGTLIDIFDRQAIVSRLRPVSMITAEDSATSAEESEQVRPSRISRNAWMLMHFAGVLAAEKRATRVKDATLEYGLNVSSIVEIAADSLKKIAPKYKLRPLRFILRTIWPELNRELRFKLFIGFTCATVYASTIPIFSWIVSKLLTTLYQQHNAYTSAAKWSVGTLAVAIVDALASFVSQICLEGCAQSWIDGIRRSAMQCILNQPRQFFAGNNNGAMQLAHVLNDNAEEMRDLLSRFIALIFQAVLLMVVSFTWSFTACWQLTLIGLGIVPIPALITQWFQAVNARYEARSKIAADTIALVMSEACVKMKTVRALTLENHFLRKHKDASEEAFKIGIHRALYSGFFYGLTEGIPDFYNALIYYAGARLIVSGDSTVDKILTVFTMLLFSIANIVGIVNFLPQINSAKDSASRLLHLALDLPPTSHEHVGATRLTDLGDIVLRNVSFAYPSRPQELVLRNVSLEIPAGSTTALVGTSGSGKSTIIALLLRMYPILKNHGDIVISARSLSRLHTPTLRSLIAVVPQTCTLFPGTIAYNISYGLSSSHALASLASVRAAAEAAGIHEFIASLPSSYETLVGEGGTTLSGGQAQRLAIARALVRRPRLLVLDEATSALDGISARLIAKTVRRSVERSRQGGHRLTVLIITHDKDMMQVADRIVMLDKGIVVDSGGRYDEMMARNGRFAAMMRADTSIGNGS